MDKIKDEPKVEDLFAGGNEKEIEISGHKFKIRGDWSWGDIQDLRRQCIKTKPNGQTEIDRDKLDDYTVLSGVVDSPFHARGEWNIETLRKLKRIVVETLLVEVTKNQLLGGDVAKNSGDSSRVEGE